jgi:Tfp pilus assembly protein PilV
MVEVMVAMIITAIAVMGIIGLYKSQSAAGSFSRHNTEAAVLAEYKLEQLRTLGTAVTQSGTDSNIDSLGAAGGLFTRQWSETSYTNFADIHVWITWTDDGVPHTLNMYGRRGP